MSKPVYFSKIEYVESIGYGRRNSVILLNLVEKELSYQVFEEKRQMPVIQGIETEIWFGKEHTYGVSYPARIVRNSQTGFKDKLLKCNFCEKNVVFSKGFKLKNNQIKAILPYCNALDFEPYRNREMSMNDEGYAGYRDEVSLKFRAITDDYIPMIELPMSYYYDKEHIWPSEKLYKYIITNFFSNNKEMKGWYTEYGGHSLFF